MLNACYRRRFSIKRRDLPLGRSNLSKDERGENKRARDHAALPHRYDIRWGAHASRRFSAHGEKFF
jgi:hypothetical protein